VKISGVEYEIERICVDSLLERQGIVSRGVVVAVNGEIVRRSEWGTTWIEPTDEVEILTAAAGG
jgi:thiamine biosynthesis protein ThiS